MTQFRQIMSILVALALAPLSSCSSATPSLAKSDRAATAWRIKDVQHGKASWYSVRTNRGTRTASGERLNEQASTAAHKTLPMGTQVRVVNLANGKSEVVRITDRGPFIRGRIIDVTSGVADRLGFRSSGVASVKVEVLDPQAKSRS
jgi:rare lipoprotein A